MIDPTDPAVRPHLRKQRLAGVNDPLAWHVAGAPAFIGTAAEAVAWANEEGVPVEALYVEWLDPFVE